MAIAAMLAAVAVPGFNTVVKNARQSTNANALLTDFHFARNLAITSNARVVVCPSSDGAACEAVDWSEGRIVFVDTDGSGTVNGAETVQRASGDIGTTTLKTEEFQAAITFRPNGRAMAGQVRDNVGDFTICDDRGAEHATLVVVEMNGRPRVSHETLEGGNPTCPG